MYPCVVSLITGTAVWLMILRELLSTHRLIVHRSVEERSAISTEKTDGGKCGEMIWPGGGEGGTCRFSLKSSWLQFSIVHEAQRISNVKYTYRLFRERC